MESTVPLLRTYFRQPLLQVRSPGHRLDRRLLAHTSSAAVAFTFARDVRADADTFAQQQQWRGPANVEAPHVGNYRRTVLLAVAGAYLC